MTARILDVITSCKGCPHRMYYTSGIYECRKAEQRLTDLVPIPQWCPLPSYPAPAQDAEQARDAERLDALEATAGENAWIVAKNKDSFTVYLRPAHHATRKTIREAIDAARALKSTSAVPRREPAPPAGRDLCALIADDAFAMSFQTMGQYRTALLGAARDRAHVTAPAKDIQNSVSVAVAEVFGGMAIFGWRPAYRALKEGKHQLYVSSAAIDTETAKRAQGDGR